MAYRVTIKLTKTDTNPWWFLRTDADIVQKITVYKELGIDPVNDIAFTDTEGVFTRDFDDKISANRFLIKLLSGMPTMMEEIKAAHPGGWTEEITTEEI